MLKPLAKPVMNVDNNLSILYTVSEYDMSPHGVKASAAVMLTQFSLNLAKGVTDDLSQIRPGARQTDYSKWNIPSRND